VIDQTNVVEEEVIEVLNLFELVFFDFTALFGVVWGDDAEELANNKLSITSSKVTVSSTPAVLF
jgi:hypothetical protein